MTDKKNDEIKVEKTLESRMQELLENGEFHEEVAIRGEFLQARLDECFSRRWYIASQN